MRIRHLLIPLFVVLTAIAATVVGTAPAVAATCPGADSGPRKISSKTASKVTACLINKKRASHGLGRMEYRKKLSRAAGSHTRHMQKTDCFDHVCPGERSLVGRYEWADYLPCGCSWGAAENIGWGPGHKGTPRRIVKAWMHSPPHRANILGNFDHIGVGVRWGSPDHRGAKAGTYTLDFGYKR